MIESNNKLDKRAKEHADKYAAPNTFQHTTMSGSYSLGYADGRKDQQQYLISKIKDYLSMEPYGVTDMCPDFENDLISYLEE